MSDLYRTTTETPNLNALLAHDFLLRRGGFLFAEELSTTDEPTGRDDASRFALRGTYTAQFFGGVVANGWPMETHANPQPHPWCFEDWAVRLGKVQGLEKYLNRICDQGFISADVRDDALRAWSTLSAATQNALIVPNACPGDEGDLLLTWDRDDRHLELEFVRGSPAVVFWADQTKGMPWESEFHAETPLERRLLSALEFFLSPAR